ncbi:MAG: ribosome assembly RNA-binding protein YhbY [Haliea sp.]|nr:ribosome assembly RNA-binding protein YhbY [Haliea sp.]|tara:strand:- start:88292 stop:88603 length:312 start_codon:yes stop_codon:yes gene_type:complete
MSHQRQSEIKHLRSLGHKLKPVVTVAGKGLSDSVLAEVERALDDHELIKVRLSVGDRVTRHAVTLELGERTGAELIQSIGNIVLLLRRAKKPSPHKSNLIRPL